MDDEGDPLVHIQGLEQGVEVAAVLDEAIRAEHCQAACRSRPCRSGRGRCSGLVAAGAATRCARGTTRWDCRAAARWGRPLPPPRTPSRCRGPAAAAFGTEMPQRSCWLPLLSL